MAMWLDADFVDEDELVGLKRSQFEGALTAWVIMRGLSGEHLTVADAMLSFNTTQNVIEQTVKDGHWLYQVGDGVGAVLNVDGE